MVTTRRGASHRTPWNLFEGGFASHEEVEANAERIIASRKCLEGPTVGPGLVLIVHGANEDLLEVGGHTVGTIRRELGSLFNVSPRAEALVGGHPVGEDYPMRHGETLEFVERVGRKGVGRVWTGDEFCILFRMTEADFAAMVASGLPVHRMEDDTVRITETEFDRWAERDEPWLFTASDLATRLHISERELWRMRSSGKLPSPIELGPKLVRWGRSEILDWIEAGCPVQRTWDLLKTKRPKARNIR